MRTKPPQKPLRRFLRRLLLIDLVVFIGAGVFCWLVGWHTLYEYGTALIYAAGGLIGLALFIYAGTFMQTGSFTYQYSMTIAPQDGHERARRTHQERGEGIRFLAAMAAYAALPLAIGTVIQYLA